MDEWGSYRPISLMNLDAKIWAKILSLVGTDQSGFRPGKITDINLHRLYTNLQIWHDNVY